MKIVGGITEQNEQTRNKINRKKIKAKYWMIWRCYVIFCNFHIYTHIGTDEVEPGTGTAMILSS